MPSGSSCPSKSELQSFLTGQLDELDSLRIETHIAACAPCVELLSDSPASDPFESAIRQAAKQRGVLGNPNYGSISAEAENSQVVDLVAASTTAVPTGQDALPAGLDLSWLAPAELKDELGRFGVFRILRVIGHGGMGVVFEAEDLNLQRSCALKIMLPKAADDLNGAERFLREARASAKVHHSNVVTIYQADCVGKTPFIAMELLHGESLSQRLSQVGALPVVEILSIGSKVADGLTAAHSHGLLHRDIKPANIWLETDIAGKLNAKLLDFGLARSIDAEGELTQSGMIVGTPQYMAPELADGTKASIQSDLFSLGCVLYEMATGRQPFLGKNILDQLRALAVDTPPAVSELRRETPPELSRLIHELLNKEPGLRPQNATAVSEKLKECESQISSQQESISERDAKPVTRLLIGACIIVAITSTTWALRSASHVRLGNGVASQQGNNQAVAPTNATGNLAATVKNTAIELGSTNTEVAKPPRSSENHPAALSDAAKRDLKFDTQQQHPEKVAIRSTVTEHNEIRISDRQLFATQSPRLAVNCEGVVVVVWQGKRSPEADWDIFACGLDATEIAYNPSRPLCSESRNDQSSPCIASLPDNRFVAAWQSRDEDGSGWSIVMRTLSASGHPEKNAAIVNSHRALDQISPAVAASPDGKIAIVWNSIYQVSRNHAWDVIGQLYSLDAERVGSEFVATSTTTNNQRQPAVTFLPDNSLCVAYDNEIGSTAGYNVAVQRFDRLATQVGSDFRANQVSHSAVGWGKGNARLASIRPDRMVVVWHDFHPQRPQDGSDHGVFFQIFDNNRDRVGAEICINETTAGFQGEQSVASLASGEFFVAWSGAGRGDSQGIFGRLFSADGVPLTGELKLNDNPDGKQSTPDVAVVPGKPQIIVAWNSEGADQQNGVFATKVDVSKLKLPTE